MKYRKLGSSNLEVSVVALGCMTFTGDSNWGPQAEKDSIETVRAAYDAGITLYDTAEGYADGLTERILGKALGADRSRVLIASKVSASNLTRDKLIQSCEASLKRLGTDYLDLYQIHWPSREIPMEETMEAMLRLKEQGKIREIGVSNYGTLDLDTVLPYNAVVSNQLAYNMLFRGIEYSVLPKCSANGIGVLTYSSLAQGLLSGKYKTADDFPSDVRGLKSFPKTARARGTARTVRGARLCRDRQNTRHLRRYRRRYGGRCARVEHCPDRHYKRDCGRAHGGAGPAERKGRRYRAHARCAKGVERGDRRSQGLSRR